MKFKYSFFVWYCICALIFLSGVTYVGASEKDIPSIQIKEIEKPVVECGNPISILIDISEHIVDFDILESSVIYEDSIYNIEEKYKDEIPYIARTVWGEARGCSKTEQAAVVWCILNRVDSSIRYMPDNIIDVITQKHQFLGYVETFPVTEEIRELVIDVLTRWEMEKAGVENVGRVLPPEYMWFHGDGRHNHFRDSYSDGNRWDWSLDSPYEVKGERK